MGNVQRGWYEQQVAAADYYGYEGYGHSEEDVEQRRELARYLIEKSLENRISLTAFTAAFREITSPQREVPTMKHLGFRARVTRAIGLSTNTRSFSYDLRSDGTSVEQTILEVYKQLPQQSRVSVAAGWIALQNMREECAVARTGLQLLQRGESASDGVINVFMTIGSLHRDLSRKFRRHNVQVAGKIIGPRNSQEWKDDLQISDAVATGIILPEDVPTIATIAEGIPQR